MICAVSCSYYFCLGPDIKIIGLFGWENGRINICRVLKQFLGVDGTEVRIHLLLRLVGLLYSGNADLLSGLDVIIHKMKYFGSVCRDPIHIISSQDPAHVKVTIRRLLIAPMPTLCEMNNGEMFKFYPASDPSSIR
jgi:hypothetical protein